MEFKLYKVQGYEEAIMALRMSKGKYFSLEKAEEIKELVWLVTDMSGFICSAKEYYEKVTETNTFNNKITGDYDDDVAEFKRLLGLTFNNAMGEFNHHTLMKYIELSFFTVGLHRGAQDDLDAHAIAFNNRITRFSSRLAEIHDVNLSDYYKDKIIPLSEIRVSIEDDFIIRDGKTYKYTPFGYVLEKYADMSPKSGLYKDVHRGGMPLGMASDAIWKIDIANLRYVYKMRSKLTKANPELKEGIEQLADQIEANVPVFGDYFRMELTDSGLWEHMNKVRTVSRDEFEQFKKWKKEQS